MNHVALAAVAGCGFALAGTLGIAGIAISNTWRVVSVALAAGVLLAVTIGDLVPEAFEMTSRGGAAFGFAGGFLALFLVESFTNAHLHHHHPADGHDHSHDHLEAHHAALPFLVGLGLHNLADGMAIGTSSHLAGSVALAVTSGVLVHQLPVGISFGVVLASMGMERHALVRNSVLLGAFIPLGAIVIALGGELTTSQLGVLVAAAGGALAYVATGHLLPEVQSEERHVAVATIFCATLIGTIAFFVFGLG